MCTPLAEKIRIQYGELPRLKSSFSATALGMFSSGWVWFVTDTGGELGVLPTFGPSTLLMRSRENMNYMMNPILGEADAGVSTSSSLPQVSQSMFSKTPPAPNMMPPSTGKGSQPTTPPLHRSLHSSSSTASGLGLYEHPRPGDAPIDRFQNVGDVIYPLFCVPVYEHAWMSAGFGVWGKENWLKEFWTVLDWRKVSSAFEHARMKSVRGI